MRCRGTLPAIHIMTRAPASPRMFPTASNSVAKAEGPQAMPNADASSLPLPPDIVLVGEVLTPTGTQHSEWSTRLTHHSKSRHPIGVEYIINAVTKEANWMAMLHWWSSIPLSCGFLLLRDESRVVCVRRWRIRGEQWGIVGNLWYNWSTLQCVWLQTMTLKWSGL